MKVEGFDWDDGNNEKCRQHGLTLEEIEFFFRNRVFVAPDLKHSNKEERFLAIGLNIENQRPMIVAFTFRGKLIRPISARYMHKLEAKKYEEAFKKTKNR